MIHESILDPVKTRLNPTLWTPKHHLRIEVKQEILSRIYEWLSLYGLEEKIDSILLFGSNCTYQYTKSSDIDVNLIIDVSDNIKSKIVKNMPNGNNLTGTLHPINFFILPEKTSEEVVSSENKGPIYDIVNDKWLVLPEKKSEKVSLTYLIEMGKVFMKGLDDRIAEYERDKLELEYYQNYIFEVKKTEQKEIHKIIEMKENELLGELDGIHFLWTTIHNLRRDSYSYTKPQVSTLQNDNVSGSLSIPNQIYKIIEKFGYQEKVKPYLDIYYKKKKQMTK